MEVALSILVGWVVGTVGFVLGWYVTNEKWKAAFPKRKVEEKGEMELKLRNGSVIVVGEGRGLVGTKPPPCWFCEIAHWPDEGCPDVGWPVLSAIDWPAGGPFPKRKG